MKDGSGVGWEVATLGEVCRKMQTTDPRKQPDKGFRYVDVSSVSNQSFTVETTQVLLGKDAPSRARRVIHKGDVIFATIRPTLMRVAQIPEDLDGEVCSTGYIVLRPSESIDARFLFYSMFRPEFMDEMAELQSGASYPAVTDKQVLQHRLPLPPLEEQKRIVAVLDQAFAALDRARAHAEANLADARELFENTLNALFADLAETETVLPLTEAVHPDCKLSDGIVQPGDEVDGGLAVVRPVDLKRRIIALDGIKTIDPTRADGYARTKLVGGELLLCVRGSTGVRCVRERCFRDAEATIPSTADVHLIASKGPMPKMLKLQSPH